MMITHLVRFSRYLGYANELGEAFRPLVSTTFVRGTYGVSTAYVLADTYDKVQRCKKVLRRKVVEIDTLIFIASNPKADKLCVRDIQRKSSPAVTSRFQTAEMVEAGTDTLLWQGLASVIVPGFTIHQIVHWTSRSLRVIKAPKSAVTIIPTAAGLGAIPFIVHPIDEAIHWLGDNTWRAWAKPLKRWYSQSDKDE
eukprot:jgi/Bigna1/141176/aug1.61_g15884